MDHADRLQLAAVSQAKELNAVRFRAGERSEYKRLNDHSSIRYPIPVNLDASFHKVSLIIQSVLGGVDFQPGKNRTQYDLEVSLIFQHIDRLIRCVIDCQLHHSDSTGVRNSLMMARSLSARAWDDSPLQMKQLHGIGNALVRKFVNYGVKSLDDLLVQEPHRIETILNRKPGTGLQLLDQVKAFPRLRVSLSTLGKPRVQTEAVCVAFSAVIGFMNDKIPLLWQQKPVHVCFLAETSDGQLIHFRRERARTVGSEQELHFTASLRTSTQHVTCYVMCDGIAGTQREAVLVPKIQTALFSAAQRSAQDSMSKQRGHENATCKLTTKQVQPDRTVRSAASIGQGDYETASYNFSDDGLDDADLLGAVSNTAGSVGHDAIERDLGVSRPRMAASRVDRQDDQGAPRNVLSELRHWEPKRLQNGNWECNHACKNKTSCKHRCCQEGVEKKPRPPKAIAASGRRTGPVKGTEVIMQRAPKQSLLPTIVTNVGAPLHQGSGKVELIDLCRPAQSGRLTNALQSGKTRLSPRREAAQLPLRTTGPQSKFEDPVNVGRSGKLPLSHAGQEWKQGLHNRNIREMEDTIFVDEDEMMQSVHKEPYDDGDSIMDEALIGLADSFELVRGASTVSARSQAGEGSTLDVTARPPSSSLKEVDAANTASSRSADADLQPRKRAKTRHTGAEMSPTSSVRQLDHENESTCLIVAPGNAASRIAKDKRDGATESSAGVFEPPPTITTTTADDEAATARKWLIDMGWAQNIEIVDGPE